MSDLDGSSLPPIATDETAGQPPVGYGGFRDGFSLARFAASRLAQRPGLTFAVVVLAAVSFLSLTYFSEHLAWHWPPKVLPSPVTNLTAVWQPVWLFCAPLVAAAISVAPLAWLPLTLLGAVNDTNVSSYVVVSVAMLPLASAVGLLVLVGLLGWTRDSDKPLRIAAWPRYWRRYFAFILLINLVLIGCVIGALLIGLPILGVVIIGSNLGLEGQNILNVLFNGVLVLPAVLLMLAPFAVVARGLGVRGAISEGGRLLRNNSPALLALFLIFIFFYGCLSLGGPWPWAPSSGSAGSGPGTPLWWEWLQYEILAVLGLWVAHAFMEIARPTTVAAPSAG
jgi:hypothetical protein